MFNLKQTKENETTSNIIAETKETTVQNLIKDTDIHVMPKKISHHKRKENSARHRDEMEDHSAENHKFKKPHKVNWLFLGILAFVVLAALITVIIIFYTVVYKNQEQTVNLNNSVNINTQPNLNQTQNLNTSNLNQNTNTTPQTAAERDQKRLSDIQTLTNALELYFAKYNQYPENLSALVGEYLSEIPQNPQPGGKDYVYAAIEDYSNYQILFSLEIGTVFGTTNLAQGNYQATPSGINLVTIPANQNVNTSPFPPIIPTAPQTAMDSDNDYLTDLEENFYQTDPQSSDSDGDTYLDGVEVRNLYSPIDPEIKLTDTELVTLFTNESYNYQIYYPTEWVAKALSSDFTQVMFSSSLGEFISVLIENNPLGLSAIDWYLSNMPNIEASSLETLEVSGLPAVKSLDGLNTYVAVGNKIYIINYNVGNDQEKVFETTYKMMLKSFTLTNLQN